MVACHERNCRQPPGRIHHMAGRQKRRRGGAASLRAGTAPPTDRRLGQASSSSDSLSSRLASSAHSAVAVCACFRRAWRLAQPLPGRVRHGTRHPLLPHRLARCNLWPPFCPDFCWDAPEMVGPPAMGLRGTVRGQPLLRSMEDQEHAQEWLQKSLLCMTQRSVRIEREGSFLRLIYTTNIATPAANMAIVAIATTVHPRRELGWPCMSFLSAATIRIATRRKGASNPLMTAVQ